MKESIDLEAHLRALCLSVATPACAWANPLIDFNSANLIEYRESEGVPQGKVPALLHKSGDCFCGAFAAENELKEIDFWFPEMGAYIRRLEKAAREAGKPFHQWGWGWDKEPWLEAPGPLCQGCSLFDRFTTQ